MREVSAGIIACDASSADECAMVLRWALKLVPRVLPPLEPPMHGFFGSPKVVPARRDSVNMRWPRGHCLSPEIRYMHIAETWPMVPYQAMCRYCLSATPACEQAALTTFDDTESAEVDIEVVTQEVTRLFRKCEGQLQRFGEQRATSEADEKVPHGFPKPINS